MELDDLKFNPESIFCNGCKNLTVHRLGFPVCEREGETDFPLRESGYFPCKSLACIGEHHYED